MFPNLNDINRAAFDLAERDSFREPEFEPPKCERCGEYPEDDYLYDFDGEWFCAECLLNQFHRKDIHLDDWGDED